MRKSGIFLAISSLPSEYGVGSFDKKAYDFVDILSKCGIKIWQILPLNPLGNGYSPYQSSCTNAIDPIYVDLDALLKEKLIKKVKKVKQADRVDYPSVIKSKNRYLTEAFNNVKKFDTRIFRFYKR